MDFNPEIVSILWKLNLLTVFFGEKTILKTMWKCQIFCPVVVIVRCSLSVIKLEQIVSTQTLKERQSIHEEFITCILACRVGALIVSKEI